LQHFGMERLEDVVHRAELVAAKYVRLVAAQRCEKNDRRVARFVALANEARGLESGEIGHLYIEQDDREFAVEERFERSGARLRLDQALAALREDRLERQQIRRLIVDEQNVDLFVRGSHLCTAS